MEKIKLTFGQAARQRQSMRVAYDEKRSPEDHVQAQRLPNEKNITYTRTYIHKVSQEILKKNRIITGSGHDAVTSAYKMLRTQVLQRMKENKWNSLAITSVGSGEGKTLTAINLAISLAKEVNHTVILVDFDLRRPSIHKYFEYTQKHGISEYLYDGVPLDQILFNPGIERLVVLPGSREIANSSEMLSSPTMVSLVEELKTRYPSRLVVFDLPPLLSTDDALAFSPYVDAMLLVIEEHKTRKDELKRAMEILQVVNIIGTVLNKSDQSVGEYSYGP